MALIKCTKCGHMISDKATKCPKCGCPTNIESAASQNAGNNNQQISQQPVYHNKGNGGNNNKWLYAIIALLLVVLAGGGYYFYNQNKQKEEDFQQKLITDSIAKVEKARQDSIEQARNGAKAEMTDINGLCKFKGSIGKYGVEMLITVENCEATGLLHYNSQRKGVNLMLKGNVEENGKMIINEFTSSGENTGCFDGVFDGETIKGTFRNFTHGKTYSFTLSSVSSLSNLSEGDYVDFYEEGGKDWESYNQSFAVEKEDEEIGTQRIHNRAMELEEEYN